MTLEISNDIKQEVLSAIRAIRQRVIWKPGKDIQHLDKRKSMGHIPQGYTLNDYNQLILSIVSESTNEVYLYIFGQAHYYGIVGNALGVKWLVLVSSQGVMETAFPPDNLQEYIDKRGFERLGKVGDFQ
ncbi:hypothetical protein FJZ31_18280 [Candidatus Poribacteria bacterium]|nr:hypothetical protein [Candidatus Poribacteria bacterium]